MQCNKKMRHLPHAFKYNTSMDNSQNKIIEFARLTLGIEIATLQAIYDTIDAEFVRCVHHLLQHKGRLVITGVGKSALTAQKIAATCNSTGTMALFMHAADAIHGDLGMIGPEDTVMCISKSGETPEIRVLVPLLRNMKCPVIAMTAERASTLAQGADYLLFTPIEKEADPNNLAPTASTTAQAAMGDALAVTLLRLRGFQPEDFALLHPGGSLGRQLYLKVEDLSRKNARPLVYVHQTIHDVILEMTSKRLGATAVLDAQDKLVGMITDGDLRRMLEKGQDNSDILAKDIMSWHPRTIQGESLAVNALSMMRDFNITQVVVCDHDGNYTGMVHLHDLIREGLL
jgi:arabinose-5-phosphate isomerase